MHPYFIGPQDKQIFVSKLQATRNQTHQAVVLFYPFGQEYMRAHKAFRQLATQLSRKGFDVYRFDYPGTGDSHGDISEMTFQDHTTAAIHIIEHIAETHDNKLIGIGLRYGALVAHAAAKQAPKLAQLIFWDPYASGEDFLDDNQAQIDSQIQEPSESHNSKTWHVHGFSLTEKFRDSIQAQKIAPITNTKATLHVSYKSSASEAIQTAFGDNMAMHISGPKNDWNFVDLVGSILIPNQLIKQMVNQLSASQPLNPLM